MQGRSKEVISDCDAETNGRNKAVGCGQNTSLLDFMNSAKMTVMLKSVKFWGITLCVGVIIGFGIDGWLYAHHSEDMVAADVSAGENTEPLVASSSSSNESLSRSGSPSSSGLIVSGAGNQGAVTGSSLSDVAAAGGGTNSYSTPTPTPSPSASQLPLPSQFSVYDKYINNASTLFQDVVVGSGKAVASGSIVTVQYRGYLTDGTEFDESYDTGKPFTFTEGAGSVIPGWEEGLFGMKAGGQRRLIVPPTEGYGSVVHGPIPANSLLIFDVVLVSVQ
jgi:peptidylprolyl isomerase